MATSHFFRTYWAYPGLQYSDGNWDTAHDAATAESTQLVYSAIGSILGAQYLIQRGFQGFDTSPLTGLSVSAGKLILHIHPGDIEEDTGYGTLHVCKGEYAGYPILTSYWGIAGLANVSGGSLSNNNQPFVDRVDEIQLNVNGISWIDVDGTTKFVFRTASDLNDQTPSGENGVALDNNNIACLVVDTPTFSNITDNSAKATSTSEVIQNLLEVTHSGSSVQPMMCSFQYGISPAYNLETTPEQCTDYMDFHNNGFSQVMTDLVANTLYKCRCKVTLAGTTYYSDFDTFTTAVVSGGPSNALSRISSIRHIYQRYTGTYQMEIILGDVTAEFGVPEDVTPASSSLADKLVEDNPKEEEQITKVIETGTLTTSHKGTYQHPKIPEPIQEVSTIMPPDYYKNISEVNQEAMPSSFKSTEIYKIVSGESATPQAKTNLPNVTEPSGWGIFGTAINIAIAATKTKIASTWQNILEWFK